MRRFLLASLGALVVCAPAPIGAWGLDVHRMIAERAIALLPADIRPYYEKHRTAFVEHAVDPDLWRNAGFEEEPSRHFVDMDAYGAPPFSALPHDYDQAVQKFGREFVNKNGTLPWRAAEMTDRLVKAFSDMNRPDPGYAYDNVAFFSSVVAHYVADAHVPFHAALNYDGQLTQQWGIHSRFESQVVLRYLPELRIDPRPVGPVKDVREAVFGWLTDGYSQVAPILAADRKAVQGRDEYDDRYFEQFFTGTRPIVERQLSGAIADLAAVITGAWEAGGKPKLPVEPPRVVRKVRRSPAK
jgi:zinc dependent phospholipase C